MSTRRHPLAPPEPTPEPEYKEVKVLSLTILFNNGAVVTHDITPDDSLDEGDPDFITIVWKDGVEASINIHSCAQIEKRTFLRKVKVEPPKLEDLLKMTTSSGIQ